MSRLRFEEIAGELPLASGEAEGFYHSEDYKALWEQLNELTGNTFAAEDWNGEQDEDKPELPLSFTLDGRPLEMTLWGDFLSEDFLSAVNAGLGEKAAGKTFMLVAPEGMENRDQTYYIAYVTPEQAQLLHDHQYGRIRR